MTTKQKKEAAEVITRFRDQLAKLRDVEVESFATFTKRVQRMVDRRRTVRPPVLEGEGAST